MKTVMHLTLKPTESVIQQAVDWEQVMERTRRELIALLSSLRRPESVDIKLEVP